MKFHYEKSNLKPQVKVKECAGHTQKECPVRAVHFFLVENGCRKTNHHEGTT